MCDYFTIKCGTVLCYYFLDVTEFGCAWNLIDSTLSNSLFSGCVGNSLSMSAYKVGRIQRLGFYTMGYIPLNLLLRGKIKHISTYSEIQWFMHNIPDYCYMSNLMEIHGKCFGTYVKLRCHTDIRIQCVLLATVTRRARRMPQYSNRTLSAGCFVYAFGWNIPRSR